jgi:hypothetical protein
MWSCTSLLQCVGLFEVITGLLLVVSVVCSTLAAGIGSELHLVARASLLPFLLTSQKCTAHLTCREGALISLFEKFFKV